MKYVLLFIVITVSLLMLSIAFEITPSLPAFQPAKPGAAELTASVEDEPFSGLNLDESGEPGTDKASNGEEVLGAATPQPQESTDLRK